MSQDFITALGVVCAAVIAASPFAAACWMFARRQRRLDNPFSTVQHCLKCCHCKTHIAGDPKSSTISLGLCRGCASMLEAVTRLEDLREELDALLSEDRHNDPAWRKGVKDCIGAADRHIAIATPPVVQEGAK